MTSLSPPLQAVIALFNGPLQDVRFADIDAAGLTSLATELEGVASEVEAHEVQLASLREALAQKQEVLLGLAQQALAYARIYAESDEALTAQLNEIALPRATKSRKSASSKPASSKPASSKPTSQSGARVSQAVADNAAAEAGAVDASKPKRKASAADTEPKAEAAASAKPGRRKMQRRPGRAA